MVGKLETRETREAVSRVIKKRVIESGRELLVCRVCLGDAQG